MHTRPMKRLLAVALLAAMVAGGGGCAAKKNSAPAGPETALLTTRDLAVVARRDVATGVPVQGTLKPLTDVNLLAPFPDVIEEVVVREGQAVQRGQVLARMRMTSVAPAAASAEAQRRIAEADLRRMENLLKEGAVAERDVEVADGAAQGRRGRRGHGPQAPRRGDRAGSVRGRGRPALPAERRPRR